MTAKQALQELALLIDSEAKDLTIEGLYSLIKDRLLPAEQPKKKDPLTDFLYSYAHDMPPNRCREGVIYRWADGRWLRLTTEPSPHKIKRLADKRISMTPEEAKNFQGDLAWLT